MKEPEPKPPGKEDVPKITNIRRSLEADIEWLEELAVQETYDFFGDINITEKTKACFVTFVVENENNEIVAGACLADYPNIPSVPKCDWKNWLHTLYKLTTCTEINSLWIHYLVVDPRYTFMFMRPMFEHIYLFFPHLINIMLIVPGGIPLLSFIEGYFSRVMPADCKSIKSVQSIYLAFRHHYSKEFKIRRAVEEDNDDLVEIINSHSRILKENMYGDFYISEILTKHPDINRQLVVAEYKEKAVAVICLNADINLKQLNRSFKLDPYNYLSKFDPAKTSENYDDIQSVGSSVQSFSSSDMSLSSSESLYSLTEPKENLTSSASSIFSSTDVSLSVSAITIINKTLEQQLNTGASGGSLLVTEQSLSQLSETEDVESSTNEQMKISLKGEQEESIQYQSPKKNLFDVMFEEEFKNAFSLELMAADKELEIEVMCDLLESTFQCFPEYDYCIVTVPAQQEYFPLISHFVRVVPHKQSTYPQELYILHKNAIKPELTVREAQLFDRKGIQELISTLDNHQELMIKTLQYLYNPESKYLTYVMLNKSIIVAFAVVYEELDFDYMYFRCNLKPFLSPQVHRYDKVGVLKYAVYSPIFQKHSKFFLREVHRLSDMTIILYKIDQHDVKKKIRRRPLPGVLKELMPVSLLNQPKYPEADSTYQVPQECHRADPDFALYISTPRICSLPMVEINNRIVVIGASDTGLSFLESLFFSFDDMKHVVYNNVTLVHENFIQTKESQYEEKYGMFVFKGHFTLKFLYVLTLKAHTNFIHGRMTAIDRRNKYITINENNILPYDLLFLACGEQYQPPNALGIKEKSTKTKRDPKKISFSEVFDMYKDEHEEEQDVQIPYNLYVINTLTDAEKALKRLAKLIGKKESYTVIIYGATVESYACLATLQKLGIPTYNLVFVEPYPHLDEWPSISFFNNPDIDLAIQEQIDQDEIEMYKNHHFFDWMLDTNNRLIKQVRFLSESGEIITINCVAMFYYGKKAVNYRTFKSINNAGLVYDGKLVIDASCRTNDTNIYAAGPMTKYSRKYYAEHEMHKYYNSIEIGSRLARHLRAQLLPGGLELNTGDPLFLEHAKWKLTVPRFTSPNICQCYLPGDYQYLRVCKPGKPIPFHTEIRKQDFGTFLYTGNLNNIKEHENVNYFLLHFNQRKFVQTITCLTRDKIDVFNIIKLWGKHASLLNNVIVRYEGGHIRSFYKFFKQPLFYPIYFDAFHMIQRKVEDVVLRLTDEPGDSVIEDIEEFAEKNVLARFTTEQQEYLMKRFVGSGYDLKIQQIILDYIGDNIDYLPMFAHYYISKLLLFDNDLSILFRDYKTEPTKKSFDRIPKKVTSKKFKMKTF